MAKTGDTVRYLNSVGGGVITRIEGAVAYVDDDGFETPVLLKECVVVNPAPATAAPRKEAPAPAAPAASPTPAVKPAPIVVEETPEGEKLNVVLAYEAADLKRISSTTFDTFLVNDSNYYLSVIYLTKGRDDKGWRLRYSGTVEPGMQIFMCEVLREDLAEMDRVCVQLLASKRDKEFELKAPVSVTYNLDTTKFCKLHCFQYNVYFDQPVIALPIVKDDVPCRQLEVKADDLSKVMRQKVREDRHTARPVQKKKAPKDEPLVVDLHIAELVDTTAGLSSADMLNLQVSHFRKVMDENLKNHGKKIVFIHGKGDGVLRKALLKELGHSYKGHDVQDASFQEYGFGATQVTIR